MPHALMRMQRTDRDCVTLATIVQGIAAAAPLAMRLL